MQVIFCRMAPLQHLLYKGFLASEPVAAALVGRGGGEYVDGLQNSTLYRMTRVRLSMAVNAAPALLLSAGGAQAGQGQGAGHAACHHRAQEALLPP